MSLAMSEWPFFAVFSNAKNFRLASGSGGQLNPNTALASPTMIDKGLLVCNSNCAVIGLGVDLSTK
jgi:hypothetical protein